MVRRFSLGARDPDRARVVTRGWWCWWSRGARRGRSWCWGPDLRDWSGLTWAQEDRFLGSRVVDRARFRTGWWWCSSGGRARRSASCCSRPGRGSVQDRTRARARTDGGVPGFCPGAVPAATRACLRAHTSAQRRARTSAQRRAHTRACPRAHDRARTGSSPVSLELRARVVRLGKRRLRDNAAELAIAAGGEPERLS
jgi:hypothetical protein